MRFAIVYVEGLEDRLVGVIAKSAPGDPREWYVQTQLKYGHYWRKRENAEARALLVAVQDPNLIGKLRVVECS